MRQHQSDWGTPTVDDDDAHPELIRSVRALYESPTRLGCPIGILQLAADRTLLVIVESWVGGSGGGHRHARTADEAFKEREISMRKPSRGQDGGTKSGRRERKGPAKNISDSRHGWWT